MYQLISSWYIFSSKTNEKRTSDLRQDSPTASPSPHLRVLMIATFDLRLQKTD